MLTTTDRTGVVEVALVDDHAMYREGAARWFETETRGAVVVSRAFRTVGELVAAGRPPSIAVLDLRLDDGSDPVVNVARLARLEVAVVAHVCSECTDTVRAVLDAGARAAVRKSAPLHDLLAAVVAVAAGERYLDPSLAFLLVATPAAAPAAPVLSAREADVLRGIAAGRTRAQVARGLGIGEPTVKTYIDRIRAKYDLCGRPARTSLALYQRAVEDGLI